MNRLFPVIAVFSLVMVTPSPSFAVTTMLPEPTSANPSVDMSVPETDSVVPRTNCITQTGTNIKAKGYGVCNGGFGNAYSRDDIDRTGAITVADALRRLDTAVHIRR